MVRHILRHATLGAVLLLTLAAYGPKTSRAGWVSDDRAIVGGVTTTPVLSAWEYLKRGGKSGRSIHRSLHYPYLSYVGTVAGPVGALRFQLAMHLMCGLLLYILMLRLRFAEGQATLASAFFLFAPWISQGIVWWSGSPTSTSTVLFLAAGHAFLSHVRDRRPRSMMALCWVATICSLMLYEIWLAGAVAFWGIAYRQLRVSDQGPRWHAARRAVRMSLLPLFPILLYTVVFLVTHDTGFRRPSLSPSRAVVVLFSSHLRVYNWFADLPWLDAGRLGLWTMQHPLAIATMSGALVLGWMGLRSAPTSDKSRPTDLLDSIILGWAMFAGARLVLIALGAVANHSRLNYAATLGAAVVVAGVLERVEPSRPGWARSSTRAVVGLLLGVMLITSAGVAENFVRGREAEQEALARAREVVERGGVRAVVAVGTPVPRFVPLVYFEEGPGFWFDYTLRHEPSKTRGYVVQELRREGQWLVEPGGEVRLRVSETAVLEWRDGTIAPRE